MEQLRNSKGKISGYLEEKEKNKEKTRENIFLLAKSWYKCTKMSKKKRIRDKKKSLEPKERQSPIVWRSDSCIYYMSKK